jgi:hypothetical protein
MLVLGVDLAGAEERAEDRDGGQRERDETGSEARL